MSRDDPIIKRIPRRSLKKRNITPSKNELPHIGSNVAFEENMISGFNIGIARRTRDGRNIHTTRREIQSMREPVQGKPPHKHIDLPDDRFIPSSSMSKSRKDILVIILVVIEDTQMSKLSLCKSVFWLEYLALLDRFHECNELQLSGTTHINSPKLHMSIVDYEYVDIRYRKIVAPGDSPNTDGIDVSASTRINIHDSNIQTGIQ
ncbi:probable polygalacturonase [Tanacetum coccineum]